MAIPTNLKKGKVVLVSGDTCPRCPHLVSSHDDSPPRCTASAIGTIPVVATGATTNRCSCVPQDVHAISGGV